MFASPTLWVFIRASSTVSWRNQRSQFYSVIEQIPRAVLWYHNAINRIQNYSVAVRGNILIRVQLDWPDLSCLAKFCVVLIRYCLMLFNVHMGVGFTFDVFNAPNCAIAHIDPVDPLPSMTWKKIPSIAHIILFVFSEIRPTPRYPP